MTIRTRFAPSPTGFLHIGSARTALFNWLYARHHGGQFLLRVEDTDRARSTQEAIDAILDGMEWLGLNWDEDVVYQTRNSARHSEVVQQLLDEGKAYRCYCTAEELQQMREEAQANNQVFRYDGRWRDRDVSEAPEGIEPTIRLKAPQEGETTIEDKVQGAVTVPNSDLDDLILLRSDGTPTYMLAVVVDDHDMGITHIIRGDDHLTNAFRQKAIYDALGWEVPIFAHIPLIHGPDGAKMSKRHGALGVEAYREMGYLPEALRNYLLRLGWSHGDDEIISTEQAIEWFNLDSVGKSPARFDFDRLASVNAHYIKDMDDAALVDLVTPLIGAYIDDALYERLQRGMAGLKDRAKTLVELAEAALFYVMRPPFTEEATEILNDGGKDTVNEVAPILEAIGGWSEESVKDSVKHYADSKGIKLGQVGPALRVALTGSTHSPGIFEVMDVLGKEETLARLRNVA